MFDIYDYQAENGRDPFKEWLAGLADRQARARVAVHVQRMAAGNFGDHKPLSDGVWELKIDHGPATGCITLRRAAECCYCWPVATSGDSKPTLQPPSAIGKTGKRGIHNESRPPPR